MYWGLRRAQLCEDVNLCPDSPGDGERCDHCPRSALDAAQNTEKGQLLRRALDIRAILDAGLPITLDDVGADELLTLLIVKEEQARFEEEQAKERS